jgi:hypothetical protein
MKIEKCLEKLNRQLVGAATTGAYGAGGAQ